MPVPKSVRKFIITLGGASTLVIDPSGSMLTASGCIGLWLAKELSANQHSEQIQKQLQHAIDNGKTLYEATNDIARKYDADSNRVEEIRRLIELSESSADSAEKYAADNQSLLITLMRFIEDHFETLREPLRLDESDKADLLLHLDGLKKDHKEMKGDLDEIKGLLHAINAQQSSKGQQASDTRSDELVETALIRIARDAKNGNELALKAIEEKSPDAAIEYLTERSKKIGCAKEKTVERLDEERIENDRELAEIAFRTGETEIARDAVERILDLRPDDLDAINGMGQIHRLQGRLDDSEKAFRQVLELCGDNQASRAAAYANLSIVLATRDDVDRAEEMLRKAIVINEELGCKEGIANQYANLGNVHLIRRDLKGAERLYNEALRIHTSLEQKEGMAADYTNLGNVLRIRGDLDRAEEMYHESLAIEKELGRKEGMARNYGSIGNIRLIRRDLKGAERLYNEALRMHMELGDKEGIATDYGNLGIVYEQRVDTMRAQGYWKKSVALFTELGATHRARKWQLEIDGLEGE